MIALDRIPNSEQQEVFFEVMEWVKFKCKSKRFPVKGRDLKLYFEFCDMLREVFTEAKHGKKGGGR